MRSPATGNDSTKLSFDLQPDLEGELLYLRRLNADDFDALCAAASDPLIWEQHPESDRYKPEVFERFFRTAIESGGAFVVIERASGRIVGSSRYWNLIPGCEIEIGWTFLERRFWGGKYNAELKRLMLQHAFRFVERVVFVVGEGNLRSQKSVQKVGARFVGEQLRPDRDGKMQRNFVYAIDR